MTTITTERAPGRLLIEPELFDRLAGRVVADEGIERSTADRIIDQALVFLKACADHPDLGLAPSEQVDLGWHAFLLYTRDYAEFCQRIAGRFIHHVPTDGDDMECVDTLAALEATGLRIDPDLWETTARCKKCRKCHQCYGGCHDSP